MRKLYSFFILATFSSSLLCMDEQFRHHLVKEIMVRNITYLSHDSLCALALVDNGYNTIIQDTVEARKNYLKKCARGPIIDAETTWHKHGSAYAFLGERKEGCAFNALTFGMGYLQDSGNVCDSMKIRFIGTGVVDKRNQWAHPRFNSHGKAYCHQTQSIESSWRPVFIGSSRQNIIEHSLCTKSSPESLLCVIGVEEGYIDLGFLSQFPQLLQAFLQSMQVRESLIDLWHNSNVSGTKPRTYSTQRESKIYSIKGVTIPDDFRTAQFDQLPEPIKNVILDKYAEQQNDALKKAVLYDCDILSYITKQLCLGSRVQDMKETFKALSYTNKFFHNYYSAEKNQQMIIRMISRRDGCNDEAAASFFCYHVISEKINYFLGVARSRNERFTEEDLKQTWYLNILNKFSNSLLSTTIWNQDYEKAVLLLNHSGLDVGLNELHWLETLTLCEMRHHDDNNKELLKRIYDAVLHKKRLLQESKK